MHKMNIYSQTQNEECCQTACFMVIFNNARLANNGVLHKNYEK